MFWDVLEKYVGYKERKLISVLLIGLAGISLISFTSGWANFLNNGIENYPFLNLRNLLGVMLLLIAIGWWKNRIG